MRKLQKLPFLHLITELFNTFLITLQNKLLLHDIKIGANRFSLQLDIIDCRSPMIIQF